MTGDPGFAWVEKELFPSEPGSILTGIDPRLQHVGKWILSVGDAAAVADVDGDGLQDLFLTRPMKRPQGRCTLFRNTGNPGFERIEIPALDEVRDDPASHGLPSCAVLELSRGAERWSHNFFRSSRPAALAQGTQLTRRRRNFTGPVAGGRSR